MKCISILSMLSLLVPFCSCTGTPSESTPEPADESPPNVVLLVLDTVRADHLGSYGYHRPTSPRIDQFAAGATRYANAVASSPWTLPSHASMFTGKPPFEHGAHTFLTDAPDQPNVHSLPQEHVTLAEVLVAEGYETAAFAANVAFLAAHWGIDQGFQTYDVRRQLADRVNQRVFEWLERREQKPFFLFVNYMDAHRPYNTRPRPGFLDPPASEDRELLDRFLEQVMPATGPVPEKLAQQVIDQYDTAIANLDEQVGYLLDRLDEAGLLDDSVVIITSDHGEYFGEHHLTEHSKDVYQPALHVPLIISQPGQRAGRTVELPVVSYDLPYLIARAVPPPLGTRLLEVFPHSPDDRTLLAENYYTRRKDLFHEVWGQRFRRVRRAVFDWPFKLIHTSDGAHELYDLDRDPGESTNLVDRHADVVGRLTRQLQAFEAERGRLEIEPSVEPLDEDLQRQLEALGYAGD